MVTPQLCLYTGMVRYGPFRQVRKERIPASPVTAAGNLVALKKVEYQCRGGFTR
jgi:hypothetical protein